MANFLNKLKERVESVKSAVKETEHEIAALFVPDAVHTARLDICMSCEHLFKAASQCKKCGCFVKVKTRLAPFKCPVDKWGKYEVDENTKVE